jgi:hypothetical protein
MAEWRAGPLALSAQALETRMAQARHRAARGHDAADGGAAGAAPASA